jgi:hypothetical protein
VARRHGPNSDPIAQGKLRSRERLAEEQARVDMRSLMEVANGRRVMYSLIFERCGVMNSYPGSDSGIYRHEGRRQLGIEIVQILQRDHMEMYLLMITEQMQAQKAEASLVAAALTESSTEIDDDA